MVPFKLDSTMVILQLAKETPLFATLAPAAASDCLFPPREALLRVKIVATGSRKASGC
jgi:hypothetical protein